MTDFLVKTTDGTTHRKGDKNPTPLGEFGAVLESLTDEGDYAVLTYSDGLTVNIPDHQIAYIAELG